MMRKDVWVEKCYRNKADEQKKQDVSEHITETFQTWTMA